MNTKFSVKQRILMGCIAFLLVFPWWGRYLKLNTYSKLVVSLIFTGILIVIGILVIILVADYRKEKGEDNKENISNANNDNVKNVVINHNYEKVNQKYQGGYSKYENTKKNIENTKFVKLTINDKNKIQIIHRITEFKNENFEYFIGYLFKFHGYTINRWPMYNKGKPLPDKGKDLIMSKDNQIYVVQIKKHINKFVSVDDIRLFNGALEKNEKGIFMTTSIFPESAEKECKEKQIIYKDYMDIWNMMNELSEDNKKYLEENYINDINILDKYKVKTCRSCGAPFIKGKNGYFCGNTYNGCNSTGYIQ